MVTLAGKGIRDHRLSIKDGVVDVDAVAEEEFWEKLKF